MGKKNKVNERLGYYGVNRLGSKFRVVHYRDANNVWIEFYEHTKEQVTIVKTQWWNIQKKEVTDIYYPSVYGVGYLGKTTSVNDDGTKKESYNKWTSMLKRCYDSKYHLTHPTYKGCSVCKEWECFANFEKDYETLLMENNFPKTMRLQLDKDILFKGNKIYSKEKCVLVPSKLNGLFIKSDRSRGTLPIGVVYHKNNKSYLAQVSTGLKPRNHKTPYHLAKYFKTPKEAFQYYKQKKEGFIKLTAIQYKARGFITENSRLFKALMNYKVEVDD